jgi:hypothetical protein
MSLYLAAAAFYILYKLLEYFPWAVYTPFSLGSRGVVQKIGHRGSRGEGLPENSRAAFVDACKSGADMIEVSEDERKGDNVCGGGSEHQRIRHHLSPVTSYMVVSSSLIFLCTVLAI